MSAPEARVVLIVCKTSHPNCHLVLRKFDFVPLSDQVDHTFEAITFKNKRQLPASKRKEIDAGQKPVPPIINRVYLQNMLSFS